MKYSPAQTQLSLEMSTNSPAIYYGSISKQLHPLTVPITSLFKSELMRTPNLMHQVTGGLYSEEQLEDIRWFKSTIQVVLTQAQQHQIQEDQNLFFSMVG